MNFVEDFKHQIFSINDETFEDSSLAVFDYQYQECSVYNEYCNSLGKNPTNVKSTFDIPFLPIEFFKKFPIKSGNWNTQKVFKSSGTSSSERSKHHIADLGFYHKIAKTIFESSFGKMDEYTILALLPSYLEQGDSSLISMVDSFFNHTEKGSGYYLGKDIEALLSVPLKKILFGVSYALTDLPETKTENTVIVETGGMKGRKKELTRSELHAKLNHLLHPLEIWSEYGMTELQSQAYGKDGQFAFPSWTKVLIREINDPFSYLESQKTGGINIIDLANVHSCSFIETKDLGAIKNGFFEVLGRFDNSDIRGCNLLV